MKRWWVLFFIFSFFNGLSQVNIDSLWNVWKDTAEVEKNRIEAADNLYWNYLYSSPDSAYYFANEIYDYADINKNKKLLYRGFRYKGISCIIQGEYNIALFHLEKALKICNSFSKKTSLIDIRSDISSAYSKLGMYDKAEENLKIAFDVAKSINVKDKTLSTITGNYGNILKAQGKFSEALVYYFKSIKLSQKTQNLLRESNAYLNIASIYKELKNYNGAIKFYNKAQQGYNKLDSKHYLKISYENIGNVYFIRGDYKKAEMHYLKALKISRDLNSNPANCKVALSKVYIKTNRKKLALKTLNELKGIKNNKDISIDVNLILAELENNPNKAIVLIEEALTIAKASFNIIGIKNSSEMLYGFYKNVDNGRKALEMYELYIQMQDSLQGENNKRAIFQFEYEKKALADSLLNIEEKKVLEAKNDAAISEQKTIRNTILVVLMLIVGFSLLLYRRFKITKRQNQIIKTQKQQVDKVNQELDLEKNKVELKNKEILSSINYAKKIQQTILPKNEAMQNFFSDFFVFYQPKDIVGGDFYWFKSFGELAVIATVDCTGHGVPGGFMSMMGSMLIDKIVTSQRLDSSKILKQLNDEVIRMLSQYEGGEIQDGMDIALCVVDKDKKQLHFSGARNGIMIVSNGISTVYHADIIPVGGAFSNKSKLLKRDYKLNTIQLTKNDMVFMYTDGYYDQFGGKDIRSLGMDTFQNILLELSELKQKRDKFLLEKLSTWKGDLPQIDDVLVMGFKV